MQKDHLQKLMGKSRRTIEYWFEHERVPKRSDFLMLMDLYAKEFGADCLGIGFPINGRELIRNLKNPDWNSFAVNELRSNDNFLSRTLNHLRANYHANFSESIEPLDGHRIGNCLPPEVLNHAHFRYEEGARGYTKQDLVDMLEILGLLYYLALLELEYFDEIERTDPCLLKMLPSYVEPRSNRVNTPVEHFMKAFFDKLVAHEIYDDHRAIVEEIEDWMEYDSEEVAGRSLRRYINEARIPSWRTFNQWMSKLYPIQFEGEDLDHEAGMIYAKTLFGATSVFDRTFLIFMERFKHLKGFDTVMGFKEFYEAIYTNLHSRFDGAGQTTRPPG